MAGWSIDVEQCELSFECELSFVRTHTQTQTQTHAHTHTNICDSIRRNAMRCISPKNRRHGGRELTYSLIAAQNEIKINNQSMHLVYSERVHSYANRLPEALTKTPVQFLCSALTYLAMFLWLSLHFSADTARKRSFSSLTAANVNKLKPARNKT